MSAVPAPYLCTFRVYYEDTDAAGIVYYANYLKFAERARTEWLRSLGFEQAALLANEGTGFVVRHCEIDFQAPAKLDDLLSVETCLQEAGKVRMTQRQTIMRGGKPLALLTVKLACMNHKGKPTRWPEKLVQALMK